MAEVTAFGRLQLASLLVLSAWLLGSSGGILLCRVSQVSSITAVLPNGFPPILMPVYPITAERGTH